MGYNLFVIFTESMNKVFEWLTKKEVKVIEPPAPYIIPDGESLKDKL